MLILSLAVVVGCGPTAVPESRYSVTWDVEPSPPRVGRTTVAVALADSAGRPIEGADVSLEGTMTHPGMQPARANAVETSAGRYEAVLNLTMGGDWVLLVDASLPDGQTIRRQTELGGVSAE